APTGQRVVADVAHACWLEPSRRALEQGSLDVVIHPRVNPVSDHVVERASQLDLRQISRDEVEVRQLETRRQLSAPIDRAGVQLHPDERCLWEARCQRDEVARVPTGQLQVVKLTLKA